MKGVTQDIRTGETKTVRRPDPRIGSGQILVAVKASSISAGTERYVVDLSKKGLLAKARARPDQVKRVLQKIKQEGLRSTLMQVQAKLDEPMSLGYSAAGVVIDAGSSVRRFSPGDRVAVVAPHASVAAVTENLCARVPENVTFEQAAYTSIATIALQGVRNAKLTLGETALVIGTGLIGLMTIALLRAQGCRVFAIDVDPQWFALAIEFGAETTSTGLPVQPVRSFSGGAGVDAVIITAATDSNEPIEFAAEVARSKGRIVLVGVAGLNIPRAPFFEKELEFTVSSSLGPGRNDPAYEERDVDYPIAYARWTMHRNMEAVLGLMGAGKLPVEKLTTHRFSIDAAPIAYNLLSRRAEPYLGIVLSYPDDVREQPQTPPPATPVPTGTVRTSLIGAGNFGRLVLLPLLKKRSDLSLRSVCTSGGLTAETVRARQGFNIATSSAADVFADDGTDAVMILTRHDLHADMVVRALQHGKHVFVEKPLCLNAEELKAIGAAVAASPGRVLMVGYNRRFSVSMAAIKQHFESTAPLSVSYRFAVPEIPDSVWVQNPQIGGGRIVGEACHAIDACIAITGSQVSRVFAECVGARGDVKTPDDRVFITLRHTNGSVSNISYQAGGDAAAPKERIEVFGGGRTAVIEDWDKITLWRGGQATHRRGGRDKGHAAELDAFFSACKAGGAWPIAWAELESSAWAAIAAMESLAIALPVERDPVS